jgi:hypothetical protein
MLKSLNTHSDTEKIIQYLQSGDTDIQLSADLEQILKRYTKCADLIKQYGSRLKVVPMMMQLFQISQAQAYRDFDNTSYVFGSTPRTSKDFYLDLLIGNIVETRTKAMTKDDFRAAAACDKNMLAVLQEYFKDQSIPWEKVQPPNMIFGFFPELTKVDVPDNWNEVIQKLIARKTKAIDADYTEIKDEPGSGT